MNDPIDVAFAECENDWDGSQLAVWSTCVSRADQQWRTSMNSSYRELMAKLPRKDGLLLAKRRRHGAKLSLRNARSSKAMET
ncbi:hypothetical protein [Lysobacter sp. HA35]